MCSAVRHDVGEDSGLNTPANFAANITTVDAATIATGTGINGYSALGRDVQ